jgi:hypothetical protein
VVLPYACARGIDTPLDEATTGGSSGAAGHPVTSGTGVTVTGGPGVGGATVTSSSTTTGAAGSTTTTAGTGGAASTTAGAGGAAGTTGGAGGAAGTTAGNGGSGGVTTGAAGMAGATAGKGGSGGVTTGAGNGGAGGAGGNGGKAGAGGSGGSGGMGGNGGAGGTPLRPTGVTLNPVSVPTALQAPSGGGTAFDQNCMTNEVVIGFTGTVDPPDASTNWLRNFQAICGSLSVSATTPFLVRTTQAETLPPPPPSTGIGSTTQTRLCATNQMVIGFTGRSGGFIDEFSFICAPLNIGGASPTFTLSIGTPSAPLTPLGGPGGSPFNAINCPANQVAVGDTGRAGGFIDAFGLRCSTPSLVVQ